jgi:hypothetical protein
VSGYKRFALAASILLMTLSISTTSVARSGAASRRLTPLQVAQLAVKCASRNSGAKITTYFDIRCAADQSSNIKVTGGVVGGPTEYPTYGSIGFLLNKATGKYTCFAFPNFVGSIPANITNDCPLWVEPTQYTKTNYPSLYAIAMSVLTTAAPQPPTQVQVQDAATTARGEPSVSAGNGDIFSGAFTPELSLRMSYASGIGRHWCLWFYQETNTADQTETTFLISPPGMYGTC